MITGSFYINTDVLVTLDTGSIMTDASAVSILVKFQDGSEDEYDGEVVDFTKIQATIPKEDNTQPGQILLQASATFTESGTAIGETEEIVILNSFAPPE